MNTLRSILLVMVLLLPWHDSSLVHAELRVPILVYHRFGPEVADSMTITTREFEHQLKWLRTHGYTIIPLTRLLGYLQGNTGPPPKRSVVITIDDGHKSVYTEVLPLIHTYQFPCTLFIYPSAISNASYALTWNQLAELKATGHVNIQSHTYWHPNFNIERKRLGADEYHRFAEIQFDRSKQILEQRLDVEVSLLAWPFGIHDPWLEEKAAQSGYSAAFTIERAHASEGARLMALPRYMMQAGHKLDRILSTQD